MAKRVYKVWQPGGDYWLVLARSRRQAVNHVADRILRVGVATDDDLYAGHCDSVEVEDINGQELIESSESPAN